MALKPDRNELDVDISYFWATGIGYGGERGGWVSATGVNTAATNVASGAAMDQAANQVWYGLPCTGVRPIGVLLNDVVNIDLTRQILNPYKSEVQVGDKVTLLKKGYVVTNRVVDTIGPVHVRITPGAPAFTGPSGFITSVASGTVHMLQPTGTAQDLTSRGMLNSSSGSYVVGRFLSRQDEDGYAKVYIDL
jgi:hypothetical protein